MMRPAKALGVGVALAGVLVTGSALAVQPRDYALNPPTPGTYANLDLYTVGSQVSVENRTDLEPGMSQAITRVSGVFSFPYADASLNLDVRVFLFTLGGSVGYRQVYRNLTFDAGEDRTLTARRQRDKDKDFDSQDFGWYEGRLRLTLPLDSFFMVNTGTIRHEGQQDNSFDYFHANMHDGGTLYKYEGTLFFRHRDFGTVGPYFRYMSSPKTRDDGGQEQVGEIHYGLVLTTRPGFVTPRGGNTDLFLMQLVFGTDDEYGMHGYQDAIPFYPLLVYRATLSL